MKSEKKWVEKIRDIQPVDIIDKYGLTTHAFDRLDVHLDNVGIQDGKFVIFDW